MLLDIFILYLMGSFIAFGLTYTLNSLDTGVEKADSVFFAMSTVMSWITVATFCIGMVKGIIAGIKG